MAAFFGVRHFTRRITLLDPLPTVCLAGSKSLRATVRLPIDNLHLAGFGCLHSLVACRIKPFSCDAGHVFAFYRVKWF